MFMKDGEHFEVLTSVSLTVKSVSVFKANGKAEVTLA